MPRWLSPSGASSASSWAPVRWYTRCSTRWTEARRPGESAMSRPAASAFPFRSTSHRPDFTTARLRTMSTSSGTPPNSPEARFTSMQRRTPCASRAARATGRGTGRCRSPRCWRPATGRGGWPPDPSGRSPESACRPCRPPGRVPRNENVFSFPAAYPPAAGPPPGAGARLVPPWTPSTPGPGVRSTSTWPALRVAAHDDGPAARRHPHVPARLPVVVARRAPAARARARAARRRRRLPRLRGVGQAARPPLLDPRRGRRHRGRLGPLRRRRHGPGRARLRRVRGAGAARPPQWTGSPAPPGSPGWSG